MRLQQLSFSILLLEVLVGHSHAADTPPTKFEVSLKKPRDKATVEIKDARALISVDSESGIGQVEIKLAQGEWPKTLVLNLSLKDLEGFYAENGALRVQTSLAHEKPEVSIRAPDGAWREAGADDRHRVKIKRVADRIEIEIPAVLLDKSAKSIRVQWIDFYR